ncbi:hypothetical protein Tco_0996669, partial [Tanacetum coccineum]
MKAVKKKEQLQKTLDSTFLRRFLETSNINSGMSSNSKIGLGYEIQSNNEVLSYEEGTQMENLCTGPREPEPNVSDDRSSEYYTCQSNDSAGSIGTSFEHFVDPKSEISNVPPEVYVSTPVTANEK